MRNEIDLSDRIQWNKTGKSRYFDVQYGTCWSPLCRGRGVKQVGWWWGGCLQSCTRFPILVGVGNGTYDVDSIRPDVHEPVVVLLLDILRRKVQERLDIFDFLELGFAKGGKT